MLRELMSAINGWLPDSLICFFVLLAVWKLIRPRLTSFARRSGSTQSNQTSRTSKSGITRPLTALLLACTTFPSVVMGFAAGYWARDAQQARSTETYTWMKVLKVYDPWDFQGQFMAGGQPFILRFMHDGSDKKLGLDEGMILEVLKFEKKPDGLSVADDHLGVIVHRDPTTSKFIDFREEN